jgi:DNA-binding MarR family transcriptional regulator
MSTESLDPVIHAPVRLRIIVTLAALRTGDTISFTRLQEIIGLTPGNLITHLRKLEDAGYVQTSKRANAGSAGRTDAWITNAGRAALDAYSATLRGLLDGV